jgi:hypothetical protein
MLSTVMPWSASLGMFQLATSVLLYSNPGSLLEKLRSPVTDMYLFTTEVVNAAGTFSAHATLIVLAKRRMANPRKTAYFMVFNRTFAV